MKISEVIKKVIIQGIGNSGSDNISNAKIDKRWSTAQKHEVEFQKHWNDSEQTIEYIKEYWEKYRYLNQIEKYINLADSSKILDIDSGAFGVLRIIPRGDRYGIDPLMDFYRSKYRLPKDITWASGVGENIPFKADFFDLIFCVNVLDHTSNPNEVLNEIKRVLNPKGNFILTVNCHGVIPKIYMQIFSIKDVMHPYHFSVNFVKNYLKIFGFGIKKVFKTRTYSKVQYYVNERIFFRKTVYSKIIPLREQRIHLYFEKTLT